MSTFDENHNYKDFFTKNNGETIPLLSYGVVACTTFFLAYTTLLKGKKKSNNDNETLDEYDNDSISNDNQENDTTNEFDEKNENNDVVNQNNEPFNRPDLKPDVFDNRQQDNFRGGKDNKYNLHLTNIKDIVNQIKTNSINKNKAKKLLNLEINFILKKNHRGGKSNKNTPIKLKNRKTRRSIQ